tara:strand:+ start:1888 stop:2133 length:246 start_codon:yes stop_codon:yes gene_type:complete
MTLNKQLDYQTSFILPVDTARKYQYGLTNNIVRMNVPIENTNLKLELNIEIKNVFGGDIKNISITEETFTNAIKKLQGRNK